MKDFKYNHGDEAQDIITGFKGVITGRADYITGCNQYVVIPVTPINTSFVDGQWFDEDRLEITKAKAKELKLGPKPGGPVRNAAPIK